MKKITALVIVLCLLLSCCMAEGTETVADITADMPSLWTAENVHTIEQKAMPMYISSLESLWPKDLPVYILDGAADLPWMDVQEFAEFLGTFLSAKDTNGVSEESDITVIVDEAQKTVTWMRRDSDVVLFRFAEQQIIWSDYQGFNRRADRPYMDILQGFQMNDGEGVIKEVNARQRLGKVVTLDLKKYGVPMVSQDGLYLVPLQTLAAFFLFQESASIYYNQECLIFTTPTAFNQVANAMQSLTVTADLDDLAALQDLPEEEAQAKALEILQQALASRELPTLYNTYKSGPKGERSRMMTDYGVHELAMELDCLYGLKESHDIDDFLLYFVETGLLSGLISTDPAEADEAIRELVNTWLDDGHTGFYSGSYLTEKNPIDGGKGYTKSERLTLQEKLSEIRRKALGDAVPAYSEIGDTAFVTLDGFLCTDIDYYTLDPENMPNDTITSIIYAHQQITRENSPIKNVVLDLSLNGGGSAPAAVYMISWMLGNARVSQKSTISGAECTVEYQADINLDHVFDEQDTLAGRGLRLFCLTSPFSFSCANLVPWAFKEEGSVKLLGGMTGGGSCVMMPVTTAWGTSYVISGPSRLSFLKNGAYYDVDQGVQPDYVISSYERFYDREDLIEFINSLY